MVVGQQGCGFKHDGCCLLDLAQSGVHFAARKERQRVVFSLPSAYIGSLWSVLRCLRAERCPAGAWRRNLSRCASWWRCWTRCGGGWMRPRRRRTQCGTATPPTAPGFIAWRAQPHRQGQAPCCAAGKGGLSRGLPCSAHLCCGLATGAGQPCCFQQGEIGCATSKKATPPPLDTHNPARPAPPRPAPPTAGSRGAAGRAAGCCGGTVWLPGRQLWQRHTDRLRHR